MKVTNRAKLKFDIENKINSTPQKVFMEGWKILLNIYSNIKLAKEVITSSSKFEGLTLGEFAVATYSLQVASNNANALSKKFTGATNSNLAPQEKTAQENLQASNDFQELTKILYPKELGKSWLNHDRLNAAHSKNLFEFYNLNKKSLNLEYFEQTLLNEALGRIEVLFKTFFKQDDIMLFHIEDIINPYSEISDKFETLSQIGNNEYSDLLLAHKQGLLIEELAKLTPGWKTSIEYLSTHKLLVQCTVEAFKDFTKSYNGDVSVIPSLIALLQLRETRNDIAHSTSFTDNIRNLNMEYYSKLYPYIGENSLFKALRNSTKEFEKILSDLPISETQANSVQSKENISAITTEEFKLTASTNSKNKKTKNKKPNELKIDEFEALIKNILDEDIKNGIRQERDKYFEFRTEAFNAINILTKELEAEAIKKGQYESRLFDSEKGSGFYYYISPELKKHFKYLTELFMHNPNILLYDNNPFGLKEFIMYLARHKDKIKIFEHIIKEGVNLTQLNNKVGNILLQFLKNKGKYFDQSDIRIYELILENLPQNERDKCLNGYISNLDQEFGFYARIEFPSSSEPDHRKACKIFKATLPSLVLIANTGRDLLNLFIKYGANINCNFEAYYFTKEFSLDPEKQRKLPKKILKMSLLDLALETDDFEIALDIVSSKCFDPNYYKEYYSPMFNSFIKNINALEMIIINLANTDDPKRIKLLLDVGKELRLKGFDAKKMKEIKSDTNLKIYKIALEYKADWLIKSLLTHVADIIIKNAQLEKHYDILEDLLNRDYKDKILKFILNEKFSDEDFIKAKDHKMTQELIYKLLAPVAKIKLINKIISTADVKSFENILNEGILEQIRETREYKALPPLNIAIMKKSPEMVALLLEHGERPTEAQLDLAKKMGNSEINAELEHSLITTHNEELSNTQETFVAELPVLEESYEGLKPMGENT
jgi:hypothetical protein